jgi:hypothetical protein
MVRPPYDVFRAAMIARAVTWVAVVLVAGALLTARSGRTRSDMRSVGSAPFEMRPTPGSCPVVRDIAIQTDPWFGYWTVGCVPGAVKWRRA